MNTQNQIKRTLSQPAAIEYVAGLLNANEFVHRSELAEFLCEHFGFYDVRGQEQRAGCIKTLRELEVAGHFTLPAAQGKNGPSTPKRLQEAVADPTGVPAKAGEVRGLELIRVNSEEHMRIWNEMMIREHPRGHGPLVGRQMRYLIGSEYGWLGAMGFAAPALQLADRDRWTCLPCPAQAGRLDSGTEASLSAHGCEHESVSDPAERTLCQPGITTAGDGCAAAARGLRATFQLPAVAH